MSQPHKRRETEEHPNPTTTRDSKILGVRVPARMNDQLEALARRENNGVSSIVRRLLTRALRERTNKAIVVCVREGCFKVSDGAWCTFGELDAKCAELRNG